jgi:GDPmannose 4,6-dehydratase
VPVPAGVVSCSTTLAADTTTELLDEAGEIDAVIHLAGRSSVAASWQDPVGTFETNARLTVALLFATARRKGVRFVHASSAEIFGNARTPVQSEATPLAPLSPYAVAKAAAHMAVQVARAGLGVPASNIVYYLGESPRRAPSFVFRKITRTVAAIARGREEHLVLGNTAVVRDFCHARDLAQGAVTLALGGEAGDYVCASGKGHSILDVAHTACELAGVDPNKALRFDPALLRPNDIASLVGDAAKLRARGWSPSVGFVELVKEVYDHDLREIGI